MIPEAYDIILVLDGFELGEVKGMTYEPEYLDMYGGHNNVYVTNAIYTFNLVGFKVETTRYTAVANDELNTYTFHVSSSDCIAFIVDESTAPDVALVNKISTSLECPLYLKAGVDTKWMSEYNEQERLKEAIPGLNQSVSCPESYHIDEADGPSESSLWLMVQHLNDTHKWSREKIADWLETLDVDISFSIGENNGK